MTDVELDLELDFDRQTEERWTIESQTPTIRFDGELNTFVAFVDGVDDDDVTFLRLSRDALFMVETRGGLTAGTTIQFAVPWNALQLTPIGAFGT